MSRCTYTTLIKNLFGSWLSCFADRRVEGEERTTRRRSQEMELHSISRKVLVVAVACLVLIGFAPASRAAITEAKLILIGDEEPVGAPGHGMISIGDTVEIRVIPTPADSVNYVIADMRKYGGSAAETLHAFTGMDAWARVENNGNIVASCSGNGVGKIEVEIYRPDTNWVKTESWRVFADTATADAWLVRGTTTGDLTDTAWTDSVCYLTDPVTGDTLFSIYIHHVMGICCDTIAPDGGSVCDHFVFSTFAMIPPDSIWLDTLIVRDGGIYWIDNTPCEYEGHSDPSVLVTASIGDHIDTLRIAGPEDTGGDPLDYDTHHTTYAILSDPHGVGAEFLEYDDYWYQAVTGYSGLGPVFGLEDNILNPSTIGSLEPDTLYAKVDMRRLSHENGNDDIYYICWDADILGTDYGDTSQPQVDPLGWFVTYNPFYTNIECSPPDNGVYDVLTYAFPILDGTTDTGPGQKIPMKWISDSGDTTYFVTLSNTIDAGIDNKVPKYKAPGSPTDSVTVNDIRFVADMDNAGDPGILNPASEGNPNPDKLRVRIDLAGLYDLSDVTTGGYAFANMMNIGFDQASGTRPFNWDFVAPMAPTSPIWQTDWVDVLASPPSSYAYDQDTISTQVWIFDNAGNVFYVGPKDSSLAVDNELPYVDPADCVAQGIIYAEIREDVAGYTGYANVGEPYMNIYDYNNNGNPLDDYGEGARDKIVVHANLGDYLGADEVADVDMINDPFCVDSIILYDDGTLGDDPVMGDKNYTGHARVEVGNTLFCHLDTDEDSVEFEVKVTDDAGNVAIIPACISIRYDNEIPTITADNVSIYFWDDPATFGIDGDENGDGIVNIGDEIIFEWRAQDEVWDDTEIDSVRVLASSIDPGYTGTIDLEWDPSGGIYRSEPYEIEYGSVDGEQLCAMFCVWDNAGNSTGWKKFCSDLELDNYYPIIDCADIEISISGSDAIASIGDTITFEYTGDVDDISVIYIDVSEVTTHAQEGFLVLNADNSWTGSIVVEPGDIDYEYSFDVLARDDVGNQAECSTDAVAIDNQPPTMHCGYAYVRLYDYNNNVTNPRVVNVGDNLTATYFDRYGDVTRVEADFSNYGLGVKNMVFGFDGGPAYKWGYRIDPVPEGNIDQEAGGLGTKVKLTAYDDAGNISEAWVCPIWFNESLSPDPVFSPGDTIACNASCVAVDIIRPGPPDADAIVFELLESSNNVANVGDRLRIIANMGDPTQPGYDMEWQTAFVEADVSQYGYGGYIRLTDDGWSYGGEGDGRFSYFFFYQAGSGYEWVEGLPILPGSLDVPAESPLTKIRLRSYDDAGNWSDWVYSDVLVSALTHEPVPVDNQIPEIDPDDIMVSFVDNDANGKLDIGDEVTISVDMTHAPGNEIEGVWAYLYDWGYPSKEKVALEAGSPVYSITFTVGHNEGEFCEGELFENEVCGSRPTRPWVEVVAKDVNGNWSAYKNAEAPDDESNVPHPGEENPLLTSWPFVWDWTTSGLLSNIIADTDAPDPVNRDYRDRFGNRHMSDVAAYPLPDGRIGLKLYYNKSVGPGTVRNSDVKRFYVYGDPDTPGEIDWTTFLGEPIPAATVPNDGFHENFQWISDVLPERDVPYHFAVLAVDDAGNMSDPRLTWITGEYADTTHFTGYVQAFNEENQPITFGNEDAYFLGYLHSEYWQVPYVEWYARVKDIDPLTEGNQPSEWRMFDSDGEWPGEVPQEPPYRSSAENLVDAFEDILSTYGVCQTFEIVIVPWDMAGNHPTLDEAAEYAFDFTYDNWKPFITSISLNGDPIPEGIVVSNTQPIEITATANDICTATTELTWELWLDAMGDEEVGIRIDRQVLPIGEQYAYTWDITNYPAGEVVFTLIVYDMAGNWSREQHTFFILDETAPTGKFYFSYLGWPGPWLRDGYHLRASDPADCVPLYFGVNWDGSGFGGEYDVVQVAFEYQLGEADPVPIATVTEYTSFYQDLYHYLFCFNTSGFNDGDIITLRAIVMDRLGNTSVSSVNLRIAKGYPVLTLSCPEVKEVCGENAVAGTINLIATDNNNPTSTYSVFLFMKKHSEPDIGDCSPDGRWVLVEADWALTQETVWRAVLNTTLFNNGLYDFMIGTNDIAGNRSWDKDHDLCIDPGAFADALANGMGMTLRIQNTAPEVRIRQVNQFEPTDQERFFWTVPVYIKCNETVTAKVWTESTCDVEKVEYYLDGDNVLDRSKLMAVSTDPSNGYQVTFPATGSICDYLLPGALEDGYEEVMLWAGLTDKLGNESWHYISMILLDQEAAAVFITNPAPNSYVRSWVALAADAINDEAIFDVTYQYRALGSSDWITIARTKANCGDPWNEDPNGGFIWWNTDLLEDGVYELRAVARDANLAEYPNPQVIRVTVDNTPAVVESFDMAPKYETEAMLPDQPTVWIGGSYVELFVDATDNSGIKWVDFYYKPVESGFDAATYIAEDHDAPFAYRWDGYSFESVISGWYDLMVKVTDLAGNETWYQQTVYIEHCPPYAVITQINDDVTPNGSRFFGVITINAAAEDGSRMVECGFQNQEWHCGLGSLQFQYALPWDNGWGDQTLRWYDLGELLVGPGPNYSINWDVSHLVGKTVYIRAKVKDNVGNIGYSDAVMIEVIDKVAPKAVIAGVDPEFSYVWAVAETHGEFEYLTVRFEYKPAGGEFESSEWTVIGEVDQAYSPGVYGVPWHIGPLSGNFWVRAVAYDDDYDPEDPDFADLYDHDPAVMLVTIANGKVVMASTEAITDLSVLGNLEDCEDIMVKAVCESKPTVIVVFDEDPEDHFNAPYVEKLLMLERPDDPTCWVDDFSLYDLYSWGNAFVIATHNDGGIVGAVTEQFKLFKVTTAEGTKGIVSQYGLAIDIPAGAVHFNEDGLIIIPVPKLIEDANVEPATTIGDPIMVTFVDYQCGEEYTFQNGNRATVTMTYKESLIPEGISEEDLLVAKWNESGRYWSFVDLQNFSLDADANTITFTTRTTGTFSVVAVTNFRISDLVTVPRCSGYTSKYPAFYWVIEDLLTDIREDEIKVVINGPAEDPILDNVTIWYGGPAEAYIVGDYDETSHVLGIKIVDFDWTDLLEAGQGWDGHGLPAGTYTLDVWAMNYAGVVKHRQFTFKVDRTAPAVDFAGTYVAPNPSFTVKVTDTQSGIVCDSMFLDVFAVVPDPECECDEYLGTLTPISCNTETGVVKFGNVTFHTTLNHEMAIDVVLYDGNYTWSGCDYGECRNYEKDHGVPDCAGNHAPPIWRRYIVDAMPPTLELVSEVGVGPVKIKITDATSGIDVASFAVTGEGTYSLSWQPTEQVGDRVIAGILTITTTQSTGKIYVSAADKVGNKSVLPVDLDRKAPRVAFTGTYVAPNPSFTVTVTDDQNCVVCDSMYADIYESCPGCEATAKHLGRLTPLSCSATGGNVVFGGLTLHLGHEMQIDVVVDGVYDCSGNKAVPVWRRYIVDAMPPTLEVVSQVGAGPVRIQVTDATSGIDVSSITVTGGVSYTWQMTEQVGDRVTGGILTITTTQSTGVINVSVADKVGNKSVLPVDLDRKAPRVAFTGTYVAPNPSFTVTVTDDQNCVVCDSMYADIYESCPGCEATGTLLGRLTPLSCSATGGNVVFGGLTLHLGHEMQIDVVVDGVYDCSGNKAVPVWRRYIVDAMPPTLEVVSEANAKTLEIKVSDATSGINTNAFVVSGEGEYQKTWTVTAKIGERVTEGILKITPSVPGTIYITAADMVGNTATITVKQGTTEIVDLIDVVNYPNPFDPSKGECATIEYTLTKGAYVTIVVYDFAGEKVKTIYDGYRGPGTWMDTWCGYNGSGDMVASGAYIGFIKVDDGTKVVTKNLKIGVYKGGKD